MSTERIDVEALRGHTPGPWSIGKVDETCTFQDGTKDEGGYRIDAFGIEQLCYVWNQSERINAVTGKQDGAYPFGSPQAKVDAALIAAAPALLAEVIERRARDAAVAELAALALSTAYVLEESVYRDVPSDEHSADISEKQCAELAVALRTAVDALQGSQP